MMQSGNRSCIRMQRRFTLAFPDQTDQHVLQPENRLISFQKETGGSFYFGQVYRLSSWLCFPYSITFWEQRQIQVIQWVHLFPQWGLPFTSIFVKRLQIFPPGSFAILRAVYSLFPVPVKYRIIVFSLPFIEIHSTIIQKRKDDNSIKNMYDRSCLSRRWSTWKNRNAGVDGLWCMKIFWLQWDGCHSFKNRL